MNTLKRIIRAIIVFCVLYIIIGAFGKKLNVLLSENHIYSEWWFYLLIVIAAFLAYTWVMKGTSSSGSSPSRKGRDYGREYTDCNKAWELIHKNGWTADDFTKARQILADGHLRYTNNGEHIKELNKKLTEESLKAK